MVEDPRVIELRQRGAQIGSGVYFGPDVYIEQDFAPFLAIEDGVVLARGVCILLHDSSLNNVVGEPIKFGKIILRRQCYIGANVTILCGVEIGANALVGACSLVTTNIPPMAVAYGQPARVHGTVTDLVTKYQRQIMQDKQLYFLDLKPWREAFDTESLTRRQVHIGEFLHQMMEVSKESDSHIAEEPTNMEKENPQAPFFNANIKPEELEEILRRIDENLILRPLLHGQPTEATKATVLPELTNLVPAMNEMTKLQSLIYVKQGGWLSNLVRSLINFPIRILNRKQILFNRALLDVINSIVNQLSGIRQWIEYEYGFATKFAAMEERQRDSWANQEMDATRLAQLTVTLNSVVEQKKQLEDEQLVFRTNQEMEAARLVELADTINIVIEQKKQLEDEQQKLLMVVEQLIRGQEHTEKLLAGLEQITRSNADQQEDLSRIKKDFKDLSEWVEKVEKESRGQGTWVKELAENQKGLSDWIQSVAKEIRGQGEWTEQVVKDVQGQTEWIKLIERKLRIFALDAREHASFVPTRDGIPDPRIVNEELYRQRLTEMNGKIKLNLGCGEKILSGYINVDLRDLPDIDIVADVRRLPFETETLYELTSAHLVEHFREHQFQYAILPYWKSLLYKNGIIRIICPNWAAMLERLNSGIMSLAEFSRVTFGGQDYEGNDHFAMYTPDTLTSMLKAVGFQHVQIIALERLNGICPEMELCAQA